MTDFYPLYLEALHRRVCTVCSKRMSGGKCGLPAGVVCPVEQWLERIVDVVHSVPPDMMERYMPRLAEFVCKRCPNTVSQGICVLKTSGTCPLNRHFQAVVKAIQEVDNYAYWPHRCWEARLMIHIISLADTPHRAPSRFVLH